MHDEVRTLKGLFDSEHLDKVPRNKFRKIAKNIEYSLRLVRKVVEEAFDPTIHQNNGIDSTQYIRFVLDKKIGLAHKFKFNNANYDYAFVNNLSNLNVKEIRKTIVALLREQFYEKKGGWIVWGGGRGASDVRIHVDSNSHKIYSLFRVNGEHKEHEDYMTTKSPSSISWHAW